jgi:SAM-dependent methyltransferase
MIMATDTAMKIDEAKLQAFLGKVLGDFGATASSALVVIGDKLGLYKAMAESGPVNSVELAKLTSTSERYIRDWLVNQAAGGYIEYDPSTERYTLPLEHALALTNENVPFFIVGGFQIMTAMVKAEPRIAEAFRTGGGLAWSDQDRSLFEGTERFFRPGYATNLVGSWIPALDGTEAKLRKGATVADVGCGHGASTIVMAQAYPESRFFGFDNHAPSIERARQLAAEAGVADRTVFEVASATDYPGTNYDLIAYFDCFHDLGDPMGATRHTYAALAPSGTLLLAEPYGEERVEDSLNPVGRIFSAGSLCICLPHALASGGKPDEVLGNMATERRLRETVLAGGFTQFRRAATTPFNRVFEARP